MTAKRTRTGVSKQPLKRRKVQKENKYDDEHGYYKHVMNEMICGFKVIGYLGKGTYSTVLRVLGGDGRICALKITKSVHKYRVACNREIEIMQDMKKLDSLNAHNCIRLIQSFDFRNHICLVFPHYKSSVYDFMALSQYKGFSLRQTCQIAFQLVEAMNFLHGSMGLIHTDLKPENLVFKSTKHFTTDEGNILFDPTIRVIDFGSSTYDYDQHKSSIISTRMYRAPEVILKYQTWSYSADIFSFGCLVYELYLGKPLFDAEDDLDHVKMFYHQSGKIPSHLFQKIPQSILETIFQDPHEDQNFLPGHFRAQPLFPEIIAKKKHPESSLIDLISSCIQYDPEKRPTAHDLLFHPFFKNL